jgi:hypothetical protein
MGKRTKLTLKNVVLGMTVYANQSFIRHISHRADLYTPFKIVKFEPKQYCVYVQFKNLRGFDDHCYIEHFDRDNDLWFYHNNCLSAQEKESINDLLSKLKTIT